MYLQLTAVNQAVNAMIVDLGKGQASIDNLAGKADALSSKIDDVKTSVHQLGS